MKRRLKQIAAVAMSVVMLAGCGKSTAEKAQEAREAQGLTDADFTVSYDGIKTAMLPGGASVHDPSILETDDGYYIYGSHMAAAKSEDLTKWSTATEGTGYSSGNPIFGKLYDSKDGALRFTGCDSSVIKTDGSGGVRIWAPDVKYSEKAGVYYMYFCTTSSFCASTLCYATADSPDGPFEWKGNLIYSGLNENNYKETDVLDYVTDDFAKEHYFNGPTYDNKKYPNALDPTIFWDADGRMWMVYGSWSGGIFLLEIDESTGQVIHPEADEANGVDAYYGKRLLGGGHVAIEAPYIVYDKDAGYYYLYVSYGNLQRTGGYQIRVLRSEKPDGPYVDMEGNTPIEGGNPSFFGLKLSGNYMLPSLTMAYMATGHNSAFISKDNKRYIVFHTRFEKKGEYHQPRVHQYFVNEEGWPCMLPYQTGGETISDSGYEAAKIAGDYYVTDQGMSMDAEIPDVEKWIFTEDGFVFTQKETGTWEQTKDTPYVHINFDLDSEEKEDKDEDQKKYSGVFCEMNDEAGTPVMTFSLVGSNESVWGVKYE